MKFQCIYTYLEFRKWIIFSIPWNLLAQVNWSESHNNFNIMIKIFKVDSALLKKNLLEVSKSWVLVVSILVLFIFTRHFYLLWKFILAVGVFAARKAFKMFDKNSNGHLEFAEIGRLISHLGNYLLENQKNY